MLNIRKMYAEDSMVGGTSFDYTSYDNVLENIKTKRNELAELSERVLQSRDVESAAYLDALNNELNKAPKSAKAILESIDRMIKSMENVRANYKAREAEIAANISNNFNQ